MKYEVIRTGTQQKRNFYVRLTDCFIQQLQLVFNDHIPLCACSMFCALDGHAVERAAAIETMQHIPQNCCLAGGECVDESIEI